MKKSIAFAFIFLLLPALARGDAGPVDKGYPPNFSQGTWGCGLNLTFEQTERLRDLQNAFLAETRVPRERLREEGRNLRELWNRKNPDREKISASQAEIQALQSEIRNRAGWYRMEAGRVLTPEQQSQLGRFPRGYGEERLSFGMTNEFARGRRAGTGYGSCPRL